MRVCCPIKAVNEANFAIHTCLIFLSFFLLNRPDEKRKKGADPPVDFLAPPRWFLGVLSTSTRGSAPAARSDYISLLFRYYYTAHSLVYSLVCLQKPAARQPIHVQLVLYCCCVVLHERQILFIFSFFFFSSDTRDVLDAIFFLKNVTRIYLIFCVCVCYTQLHGGLAYIYCAGCEMPSSYTPSTPQGRFRYRLNSLFSIMKWTLNQYIIEERIQRRAGGYVNTVASYI
jgi:hypothetical protein